MEVTHGESVGAARLGSSLQIRQQPVDCSDKLVAAAPASPLFIQSEQAWMVDV